MGFLENISKMRKHFRLFLVKILIMEQQQHSELPQHRHKLAVEHCLFLSRFVKNPRNLGAIWPSSRALGSFIGKSAAQDRQPLIVEIGAGTGRLTRGLLDAGVSPQNLICIEMDKDMCSFLKRSYPYLAVCESQAQDLAHVLPPSWLGSVTTIVSGIPMMNLSPTTRLSILEACTKTLGPGGRFLQFTYSPIPPFPSKKLGFSRRCLGRVWLNIPPAFIWEYKKN